MSVEDLSERMKKRRAATGDWRDSLLRTAEGKVLKNLHNAAVALRCHPAMAGRIAHDEFTGCTVPRGPLPWDDRADRQWSDSDDIKATEWLQGDGGVPVGSGIAREAVLAVAHEHRFHPITDWLNGLKWDGSERLSDWLTTCLGVAMSPLARAFARKFLISAVARVMQPGCKVDHMLVLEGSQGILKSKALHALTCDGWFTDQIADLGTKDSSQDLRGVWIVELSELSAIRPAETEKVKAYISRQVDHYRPSYGRRSINVPRQCVFVGTTNAREYLTDMSGGRRFWPVRCSVIDIASILRDRDQLWAEALVAYRAGESWWLDDDELRTAAEAEQEARRVAHPWEQTIADWLDDPRKQPDQSGIRLKYDLDGGRVTVAEILQHAIGKPVDRLDTADQMKVGKVLVRLGWKKRKSHGNSVWEPPSIPESEVSPVSVPPGVPPQSGGDGRKNAPGDTGDTYTRVHAETGEDRGEYTDSMEIGSPVSPVSPDWPEPGTKSEGHRYLGGDPADPVNWEPLA